MFSVMRSVVELFGYEEYDAPIIEPLEIYLAKSGEEIVNEQTYTFEDRGRRKVALRPEMTPSVSRMVAARRQELSYPLRWYSIPNLWRYERPQNGRLREHWQLNVDIFGVEDLSAEIEIIQIANQIMVALGAKSDMYKIKINSRLMMEMVLGDYVGIAPEKHKAINHLIDRKHKMESSEFDEAAKEVLGENPESSSSLTKLNEVLTKGSLSDLPERAKLLPNFLRLEKLINALKQAGIENVEFDPTVVRGLDYYTDIVFEIYDNHPDNNRSMFGGGRYDGLVGLFGVEPVPTVGFGMGDVTMKNFLELHNLVPTLKPETEIYVIMIEDVSEHAHAVVSGLRDNGVKVAVDWMSRKTDKAIKTAVKKQVPFVLFIGHREVNDRLYTLKELASGQEQKLTIDQIVELIKKSRN
jgi:histidyl-tRNA synthetase